mgnify:CR=1 FL=1
MNLIIDQGNTKVKLAVFEGQLCTELQSFEAHQLAQMEQFIQKYPVEQGIYASVVNQNLKEQLQAVCPFTIKTFPHFARLPFSIEYQTPKTLGIDRVALVAAAYYDYPKTNCLVIDAGTCITYDFITAKGVYMGGAISPGLNMRYQSLHQDTANLPLVTSQTSETWPGTSTQSSIEVGVVQGILNEVAGTIQQYENRFAPVQVLITGGNLLVLDSLVKNNIFAAPNLLLKGLNNILQHYAAMP